MTVGSQVILNKINQAHDHMHDMYNNSLISDDVIDFVNDNFESAKNMLTSSSTKVFKKKLVTKVLNNCSNLNKGMLTHIS